MALEVSKPLDVLRLCNRFGAVGIAAPDMYANKWLTGMMIPVEAIFPETLSPANRSANNNEVTLPYFRKHMPMLTIPATCRARAHLLNVFVPLTTLSMFLQNQTVLDPAPEHCPATAHTNGRDTVRSPGTRRMRRLRLRRKASKAVNSSAERKLRAHSGRKMRRCCHVGPGGPARAHPGGDRDRAVARAQACEGGERERPDGGREKT